MSTPGRVPSPPASSQIPIEFDGLTYYLRNTDGSTNIADGTAMAVEMTETKSAWNILAAGDFTAS